MQFNSDLKNCSSLCRRLDSCGLLLSVGAALAAAARVLGLCFCSVCWCKSIWSRPLREHPGRYFIILCSHAGVCLACLSRSRSAAAIERGMGAGPPFVSRWLRTCWEYHVRWARISSWSVWAVIFNLKFIQTEAEMTLENVMIWFSSCSSEVLLLSL